MLHKLDSIESIIGPSTISNNWIYVVAIEQKINVFWLELHLTFQSLYNL